MCLIVFAYKTHPDYKLVLAANRDEFYERPTTVAGWWDDKPQVLGGRDLQAKGTWMGISKNGRFASVTNYRDIANIKADARSRGDLPVNFLMNGHHPEQYGSELKETASEYNGYNLLVYDDEMAHFSNYENSVNVLKPGVYGLSNALLDTPWPKVMKAKSKFEDAIANDFSEEGLIELMQDSSVAPDDQLPATGLDLERERALSAMCIRTPNYGTCCSTAVTIDYDDNVRFMEYSYPVGDRSRGSVSFDFKIEK